MLTSFILAAPKIKKFGRTFVLSLLLVSTLLLSACSSVSYYTQSVVGHSRLMLARQPISKAITKADPELTKQLQLAIELRQYAVNELGLPDNNSYQSYVPLKRDFPVWVVVATQKFSLDAKQWCYLVIGCASYRGYFSLDSAKLYAKGLQKKGYETYIGGATAYSTLGWFADPLLPSMLRYGTAELAETLFHELAHQVVYVNGDSDFNEAFASVVGEQGALRWLKQNRPADVADYVAKLNALDDFSALIQDTKKNLTRIYEKPISDQQKQAAKDAEFENLKLKYQSLKLRKWQNQSWFDSWFETPLDNARLAAFSTYRDRIPQLQAVFEQLNGDFDRFYRHFLTQFKKEKTSSLGLEE